MKRPVNPDERGFTLVELTVAITIQAMIVTALGVGFVGILNGTKSVNGSLARSGDARLAAAYLMSDAANSSGPEVSLSDTASCPDPSPPVSGTPSPVARFTWDSTSSTGATTTNIANYVLVSNSLLRRHCKNGTLVVDRAVASNVQAIAVACAPTTDCSGDPTSITLTVTALADAAGSFYNYKLTGSFRKLNGAGGPAVPTNPRAVITLGSGTNCSAGGTGISLTASSEFVTYGDVFVNSVNAACQALSMTSNATYQAGGTKIITGGTCSSTTGASPCPTYTNYSPALSDPYASLPVPANGTSRSGCSGGVAQPGVYASTLNITGTNCQLATGTYVLQNGLTVAANSSASANLTSAAGGVLIYITGGSVTTGSNSWRTGTINLAPMSTGPYAGVAMWQAQANTNNMSFAGSGSSVSLSGALYSPNANVNISSSGNSVIKSIVARTIWMASGEVQFGTPSASPLSITGPSSYAAEWTVNRTYPSSTLTASGGDGNYTWTVTGLPPGVSADPVTGVVSGTPTSTGTYFGSVTLSDMLGNDPVNGSYWIVVNATPNITTASLNAGTRTVAYSKTMAVSGGTDDFTWGATGLPAGLSMNASTGVISGTPTTAGTSSVTVTVTDETGATDSQGFSLVINNMPNITTASLPGGSTGTSYSSTVVATSGSTPYTWSATGLPSGLSINSSTGVISGTPTAAGTVTVAARVTDAAGAIDNQNLSLTITASNPTISSVTLANTSGDSSGTIEEDDTITIVFSAQMDVSDFCSDWWNDSNDQELEDDNDVTVTVTNGSPDVLTVTSGSCTFRFGSLNLGSSSYVSSTATFRGSGYDRSKIEWDASARTMVITLGSRISGSVNYVSSSTPVYTASSSVSDTNGNLIGNSPFTLPTGRKF